jgi:hypothetical protein
MLVLKDIPQEVILRVHMAVEAVVQVEQQQTVHL